MIRERMGVERDKKKEQMERQMKTPGPCPMQGKKSVEQRGDSRRGESTGHYRECAVKEEGGIKLN